MTQLTREALEALIADDEHGLLTPEVKPEPVTNTDILANRFEEINTFIDEHDRNPDPNKRDDIGEFQLGHRLHAILDNSEYRAALEHLDRHGLFAAADVSAPASIDDILGGDDPLLGDLLGHGGDDTAGLFERKHLPPPSKESPDKVAQGRPCEDFDQFEQRFIDCHADLRVGRRKLVPFNTPSNIKEGAFYVQRGMLVYVAAVGELTRKSPGLDGRLRCIYENGTESDLLLQSLARGLYDEGKIVTEPNDTYVETFATAEHMKTGHVYVARTHSTEPALAQFTNLHKIGYTTQAVAARLSGAANDATFLHAEASLVDTYEMPAEYAKLVETLLHQFFSGVRLDVWYDAGSSANEWFDVPPSAIAEAIELIQTGQLANYRYLPTSQTFEIQ